MEPNTGPIISSHENLSDIAASIPSLASGCEINRIFMPLSEMNTNYLETLRSRDIVTTAVEDFFAWTAANFNDALYRAVQNKHLSNEVLAFLKAAGPISAEHKYLDYPFWTHSKLTVARHLNLHTKGKRRILDLGAGPGHLGVVAAYLGCDYLGLDIPLKPRPPSPPNHLFDDLCQFFAVKKHNFTIRPFTKLGLLSKFDVVTCQMGTFCYVTDWASPGRPWNWNEWVFLLCDLIENALNENFLMYFHVSRDFLPAEVWTQIERFAAKSDRKSCTFSFDNRTTPDLLRSSISTHN